MAADTPPSLPRRRSVSLERERSADAARPGKEDVKCISDLTYQEDAGVSVELSPVVRRTDQVKS